MTMTLISSVVPTVGTTSVVFNSIPQSFDELYLVGSVRTDGNVMGYGQIIFNGATSGWTAKTLYGTGTSVATTSYAGGGWPLRLPWEGGIGASIYNNFSLSVPDYASNKIKVGSVDNVTENTSNSQAFQEIHAFSWASTAAITSLTFSLSYGNFYYNCNLSLYGIKKGSGGATVS